MNWEEMYDILIDVVGLSKETVELAFGAFGTTEETGKKVLYYETGYNDFESYLESLED